MIRFYFKHQAPSDCTTNKSRRLFVFLQIQAPGLDGRIEPAVTPCSCTPQLIAQLLVQTQPYSWVSAAADGGGSSLFSCSPSKTLSSYASLQG